MLAKSHNLDASHGYNRSLVTNLRSRIGYQLMAFRKLTASSLSMMKVFTKDHPSLLYPSFGVNKA